MIALHCSVVGCLVVLVVSLVASDVVGDSLFAAVCLSLVVVVSAILVGEPLVENMCPSVASVAVVGDSLAATVWLSVVVVASAVVGESLVGGAWSQVAAL